MRRTAENGAGAVIHQYEIRDIDRQHPVGIEGMGNPQAGVEAEFLGRLDRSFRRAARLAVADKRGERLVLRGEVFRQRMVRRDRQEFRAEQRIGAGRIDLDLGRAAALCIRNQCEADAQPLGPADPVALHQPHFFRPAVERVERGEQVRREIGDREEPLRQFALLDECAGAPAATVDHLLVGEHGAVDRVPVHARALAPHEAGVMEIDEQPLLVLVIGRIAGREFARPVERQAHRLELRAHRVDVRVGPGRRMGLVLDRGVFGRHAERVPSHRVHDIEAARALVAGDHVAHRIIAHMPHVDAPRRIGEHFQDIVFRAVRLARALKDLPFRPDFLPAGFGSLWIVPFRSHRIGLPGNSGLKSPI